MKNNNDFIFIIPAAHTSCLRCTCRKTDVSYSGRGGSSGLATMLKEKNKRIKELETELLLAARFGTTTSLKAHYCAQNPNTTIESM